MMGMPMPMMNMPKPKAQPMTIEQTKANFTPSNEPKSDFAMMMG